MSEIEEHSLASEADTARLAADIAARAPASCLIALVGTLGAGKTAFTRAFVSARAPELRDYVSSPTWALCNSYPSEPPIHHLDLYRIDSVDDLEGIGFWDLLDDATVLVEWGDRIPLVLEEADVIVELHHEGEDRRRARVAWKR